MLNVTIFVHSYAIATTMNPFKIVFLKSSALYWYERKWNILNSICFLFKSIIFISERIQHILHLHAWNRFELHILFLVLTKRKNCFTKCLCCAQKHLLEVRRPKGLVLHANAGIKRIQHCSGEVKCSLIADYVEREIGPDHPFQKPVDKKDWFVYKHFSDKKGQHFI